MAKTVTVRQIQKLDRIAINQVGVPSLALMENAGRCVADEVIQRLKRTKRKRVCIVCGLGNNAGDGFVAARHLINDGIKPVVFCVGKGSRLKADAAVNYRILRKIKYPVKEIKSANPSLTQAVQRADIVVDAIFGVGLNRAVKDPFKGVIDVLNQYHHNIIAVDIPSGLDGTTGQIYDVCVKAKATVTFSFAKKGFRIKQGSKHTGKVIVVDIGIPSTLKKKI